MVAIDLENKIFVNPSLSIHCSRNGIVFSSSPFHVCPANLSMYYPYSNSPQREIGRTAVFICI